MSKPEKPPTNVYSKDELPERPSVEVKRFKTEDGREGSYAPLGDRLTKVLFDDGEMLILGHMGKDSFSDPAEENSL